MRDLGTSDNQDSKKFIELKPYTAANDPFIYRVSIITLAGSSFVGIATISALSIMALEIPQSLTAVTSGGLGALIALFSRK